MEKQALNWKCNVYLTPHDLGNTEIASLMVMKDREGCQKISTSIEVAKRETRLGHLSVLIFNDLSLLEL